MLDAERVPTLVQLQRRMAFLEAYQREVLEGPGSEFPDMYPGNGEGSRASYRGVPAGRDHGAGAWVRLRQMKGEWRCDRINRFAEERSEAVNNLSELSKN